jgi:hypothetical protein
MRIFIKLQTINKTPHPELVEGRGVSRKTQRKSL